MNFTGYFLLGSKLGGLTRKPWTLSPKAPGNQKDSRGEVETWERTASFACVSCAGRGREASHGKKVGCPFAIGLPCPQTVKTCPDQISFGAVTDMRVKSRLLPSCVTARSSLYPAARRERPPKASFNSEPG